MTPAQRVVEVFQKFEVEAPKALQNGKILTNYDPLFKIFLHYGKLFSIQLGWTNFIYVQPPGGPVRSPAGSSWLEKNAGWLTPLLEFRVPSGLRRSLIWEVAEDCRVLRKVAENFEKLHKMEKSVVN